MKLMRIPCASSITFLVMRPHRYVFGLGYGSGAILSSGLVVINMMLEIVGEAIIDILAAYTELKQGIPLNDYFLHWNEFPTLFTITIMNINAMAILMELFIFKVQPRAIFCTTPDDVCSCQGGGFDVYQSFCIVNNNATNGTADLVGQPLYNASVVKASYVNPFDFMGDNLLTIVFGVVVLVCVLAIMTVAMYVLHLREQDTQKERATAQLGMRADANKK